MNMKKIFSYFFFSILFLLASVSAVQAEEISAPTILEVGEKLSVEGDSRFFVKGLTEENTDVLFYVNEIFAGLADVRSENSGTDNYYFEYDLTEENFEITAIARSKKNYLLSSPKSKNYQVFSPPAPTIIFPAENATVIGSKINIAGLSRTNSFVEIYINDKMIGETGYLTHESGTADFSFHYSEVLSPGKYKLYLKARNILDNESNISKIINFEIIHPMPAPTLFEPVVNNSTVNNKPFIVGLAKNNSRIKIFIDNEYDGDFLVDNHESGTANFAYIPKKELTRGRHIFYATASDFFGKESKWSNIEKYEVRQPMIAEAIQEENKSFVAESLKQELKEAEEESPIVLSEIGDKDENNNLSLGVDDRSEPDIQGDISGSFNEDSQKQSQINKDLIVFLAFLLGIIIWIVWVNKELIKEKKQAKEDDNKTSLDNDNI